MDKETIMLIDIPFNTGYHPFWPEFETITYYDDSKKAAQTKEWIDYRIGIFFKYTLNSLINQTNQNFKCVVRYSKGTEELVKSALSKYEDLPDNVMFTSNGDEYIEKVIDGYKYIYHIRLDSDNMYSKDFVQQLYDIEYYEELQCILCQVGYMYEIKTSRLAKVNHGSPSFYALIYTVDDFICGFRHYVVEDHWGAAQLVNEKIKTVSYMIIVHGKNVSNEFDVVLEYPFIETKEIEDEKEKEIILREFNI